MGNDEGEVRVNDRQPQYSVVNIYPDMVFQVMCTVQYVVNSKPVKYLQVSNLLLGDMTQNTASDENG